MKYVVFSKWTWLYLLWMQAWAAIDMLVLRFDPVAQHLWWFVFVCLVQPVFAILTLVFQRKRKGMVRLTREGDTWRWRLV